MAPEPASARRSRRRPSQRYGGELLCRCTRSPAPTPPLSTYRSFHNPPSEPHPACQVRTRATLKAEPHAAVKKLFGPNARQHGTPRRNPWKRDRHCHPPLPALVQALDAISKRDPAATFNRYIHIDVTPLTWSSAHAREISRAIDRKSS